MARTNVFLDTTTQNQPYSIFSLTKRPKRLLITYEQIIHTNFSRVLIFVTIIILETHLKYPETETYTTNYYNSLLI